MLIDLWACSSYFVFPSAEGTAVPGMPVVRVGAIRFQPTICVVVAAAATVGHRGVRGAGGGRGRGARGWYEVQGRVRGGERGWGMARGPGHLVRPSGRV